MICEKALIRQLRENFKGAGYRVGTMMRGGQELLVMNGMAWVLEMPYSDASKGLKAQIVTHTGEMPGKAVKVQKDTGVQLEIAGELEKMESTIFEVTSDMIPCRRTCLYLGDKEIWQDSEQRCFLFNPALTGFAVADEREELEIMTDGRKMILDSGTGKALAMAMKPSEAQQEILDFLSGKDWTGENGAEAPAPDMDQEEINE